MPKKRTPAGQRILPGFPVEAPFTTREAADAYLGEERLLCLRCGQRYRGLGHHIVKAHDMNVEMYQDHYRLRRGPGLVGASLRLRWQDHGRGLHESGKLSAAPLAAAAAAAGTRGAASREAVYASTGRKTDMPEIPYEALRDIIVATEGGTTVSTAIKQSGWSWTGVHAAIPRHPDLAGRMAKVGRRPGPPAGRKQRQ